MSKIIAMCLFLMIVVAILGAIKAGGGGIVTTDLTQDLTTANTTIAVTSTDGYLDTDYIIIGEEQILYTGKTTTTFTGVTRGYDGTEAASHDSGDSVYTATSSALNNSLGFNVAAEADTMGRWAIVTVPFNFLTRTIPHVFTTMGTLLYGDLAILSYLFFAAIGGIVISVALAVFGARRV